MHTSSSTNISYLTQTSPCFLDSNQRPLLIVVIDTEEEFDWGKGFSSRNTSVGSMRNIGRVQKIFDEFGICPVYVIDYPVASQPEGYEPLQKIFSENRCEIGAHLHPWVNPPMEEEVSRYNSFPGNLPANLEFTKLRELGKMIHEHFGIHPEIYKAGRYGIGTHTQKTLEEQGYKVDLSLCPYMNYSNEGGPDFSNCSPVPFWFGKEKKLLELPLTIGYAGVARKWGHSLHALASSHMFSRMHFVGILARMQLVDKIWLSPEGFLSSEHLKLVKDLYADGLRVFSFAFHSPSVEPGCTPYVRTQADLDKFLGRCSRFFEFFLKDLNGQATTPLELYRTLSERNDDLN